MKINIKYKIKSQPCSSVCVGFEIKYRLPNEHKYRYICPLIDSYLDKWYPDYYQNQKCTLNRIERYKVVLEIINKYGVEDIVKKHVLKNLSEKVLEEIEEDSLEKQIINISKGWNKTDLEIENIKP